MRLRHRHGPRREHLFTVDGETVSLVRQDREGRWFSRLWFATGAEAVLRWPGKRRALRAAQRHAERRLAG